MKAYRLCVCALFTALTAVLSQVAIPIGPVPINLASFSVFCAGAVLGPKLGALSQAAYVLLGIVGVPVFSLFRGGPGMLLGPTGGYIAGYVLAAWLIGLLAERRENKALQLALAMLPGFAAYMLTGAIWYLISTNSGLWDALLVCVLPFLLGDFVKIILAALLSRRLRPFLQNKLAKQQPTV
jgi:biotin transport system substrate-specific component